MIRFLNKDEYADTRALFAECFGDEAFEAEYYAEDGDVYSHRVLVKEEDGKIVSMLHLAPMRAYFEDGHTEYTEYIMCVSTAREYRHRGYMDELMGYAEAELKREGINWTFLVAVDKAIYRHLGYVYDWQFNEDETDILYADEGLTDCSAKLLLGDCFETPKKLEKILKNKEKTLDLHARV